ncbi:hypothetical protein SARC_04168 [Sphaeroforma arctica JP610]|uniref:Aspartate racemase n=1 Tax=Sphaeroforma arctica JP610 TaxID=667725 RepID=A0A0L0G412_9EUKA|nr:hypothetical protein SARC_04168 [Sphaeroforma arctica JP610]KNC83584.1 hypothetical protein SARC_04168 [Sphaeroforma arctica JP610]|eukprot:XP_014157486.1 hypothetical protein SARC_04168 [Sphaeroforma arctica JP610]
MSSNNPRLGILTGISYVSGVDYYRTINELASSLLPRGRTMIRNPHMNLVSVDCDEYATYLNDGDMNGVLEYLYDAVKRLLAAGSEVLVIASNTGHCVVPLVEQRTNIPILHIADTSAHAIKQKGLRKVGLLGTKPTMQDGSWLKSRINTHGIEVVAPTKLADLIRCYDIICLELSANIFRDESAEFLLSLIQTLVTEEGCEGVILGCTELEILLTEEKVLEAKVSIPLFRSAALHIHAAANIAAGQKSVQDYLPPNRGVQGQAE